MYNNSILQARCVCTEELKMKKILTVCILIAAVFLLATGTVFADTQSGGQTYYIANENITVYTSPDGGAYQPAFIIPQSYYFRTLATSGEYTLISYNGNADYSITLAVLTSDLNAKASVSNDDVTDSTAGYKIIDLTLNNKQTTLFYAPGNLETHAATGDFVTQIDSVLGVYRASNNKIYFALIASAPYYKVLLVEASATNKAAFTMSSIPLHQITVEKNNAENEGVISTPGDGNADVGGNNVIRNVMIAVICIMCVLVIFLIFRPTKNAKNRYEMENRENAERDRYDGYGR